MFAVQSWASFKWRALQICECSPTWDVSFALKDALFNCLFLDASEMVKTSSASSRKHAMAEREAIAKLLALVQFLQKFIFATIGNDIGESIGMD